ncbi:hypothetical protein LCGC14_2072800 [marine sediment metagenome]|uniref:Methyltransferase small domain-containing protein n=1 Tax=marine sediment metagenome TaxID=412755 RepID=A0A0F9EHR9_9ZZZZ
MNPGILRLLHLREQTEAAGETMASERGRFAALADPSAAPRVVSSFNLFQTPPALAERLAGYLLPVDGGILEPSAGLGRLYRAIRDAGHAGPVVMVEQSPQCCRELYELTVEDQHATLKQGDFLTRTAADLGGFFDGVIMNPPFKQWRDIKHIRHARTLLGPAGRLVSICANGPRQRAALMDEATDWIDLPPGSFIEEGTHVNAAIVVVDA